MALLLVTSAASATCATLLLMLSIAQRSGHVRTRDARSPGRLRR